MASRQRLLMRDTLNHASWPTKTQLKTDQLNVYLKAVDHAFKGSIDYAMLHKVYKGVGDGKDSPAECIGCTRVAVMGDPDRSTSPRPTWNVRT